MRILELPDDILGRIHFFLAPSSETSISLFSSSTFDLERDPINRRTLIALSYTCKRLAIFARQALFSDPYLLPHAHEGQIHSLERRLLITSSPTTGSNAPAPFVRTLSLDGRLAVPTALLRACAFLKTLKITYSALGNRKDVEIARNAIAELECLDEIILDCQDAVWQDVPAFLAIANLGHTLSLVRIEHLVFPIIKPDEAGPSKEVNATPTVSVIEALEPILLDAHRVDLQNVSLPLHTDQVSALFELPQDLDVLLLSARITHAAQIGVLQDLVDSVPTLRELHLELHASDTDPGVLCLLQAGELASAVQYQDNLHRLVLGSGCDHVLRFPASLPASLSVLELDAPSRQIDRSAFYNFGPILETVSLLVGMLKGLDCPVGLKMLRFNERNWPFVAASVWGHGGRYVLAIQDAIVILRKVCREKGITILPRDFLKDIVRLCPERTGMATFLYKPTECGKLPPRREGWE